MPLDNSSNIVQIKPALPYISEADDIGSKVDSLAHMVKRLMHIKLGNTRNLENNQDMKYLFRADSC